MSLVLPDTHLLLWLAGAEARLPPLARTIIDDRRNTTLFSVASIWEIAIKAAQGRADFKVDVDVLRRRLMANGYVELDIKAEHALVAGMLSPIHRDPFDRMLVAQARVEAAHLLTANATVARYDGWITLVR